MFTSLENQHYRISKRINYAILTQYRESIPGEPLYRRLRLYAVDPSISDFENGIATAHIDYEELKPGPVGSVLEIANYSTDSETWAVADLDNPMVVMQDGYEPSLSNPRFHQQMVYAVAMMTYKNFSQALGRDVSWSFQPKAGADRNRLLLLPHGQDKANAWYDKEQGRIVFGYYKAKRSTPLVGKDRGYIFTSVSHDVIAHEMSHALLDGLRPYFLIPSYPDMRALHEAIADLVAFFQHFTFEGVVRTAVREYRGDLEAADILVNIATEFGRGLIDNDGRALRTLLEKDVIEAEADHATNAESLLQYADAGAAPHELGGVMSRAVFEAFLTVYRRRIKRYYALAASDSGGIPVDYLPPALEDELVFEAQKIAKQFLSICIRALDYCPPVDVRFGDYLRALITADMETVPDDKLGYRDALIKSFGRRGIYGQGTQSMAQNELHWNHPRIPDITVPELSFGQMKFDGDPAKPVDATEMQKQARAIGELICQPQWAEEFGMVSPHSSEFSAGDYRVPVVESVRTTRRVGPDRKIVLDTVAEVIQTRSVNTRKGEIFDFYGGATLVFGSKGNLKIAIRKRINNQERLTEQIEYMESVSGRDLWTNEDRKLIPANDITERMCVSDSSQNE